MEDNRIKGIGFMLVSGIAFALMSAAVKAVGDLPVYEKVFSRNFISLIVASAILAGQRDLLGRKGSQKSQGGTPAGSLHFLATKLRIAFGTRENQGLLMSRSLLGLAGVYLLFGAISAGLPLTDANILSRLNPAFVTLFACFFLKEKIPRLHVPLLIVIIICAVLVIKPTFDLSVLPALAAIGTAICAGATYTIVRYLKGKEEPATIVFYFSFISVVVMLIPTIIHFEMPSPMQLVWLLAIGVTASVGQFGLTFAYKFAKASEVSVYSYSTILFALLLDLVLWGKVPDVWSLIGGAGIIASAVILFLQNRTLKS